MSYGEVKSSSKMKDPVVVVNLDEPSRVPGMMCKLCRVCQGAPVGKRGPSDPPQATADTTADWATVGCAVTGPCRLSCGPSFRNGPGARDSCVSNRPTVHAVPARGSHDNHDSRQPRNTKDKTHEKGEQRSILEQAQGIDMPLQTPWTS